MQLEGGEAFFTVAHNRERPFIVKAGDVRIRAVGTAFNVRRAGTRVVVAVTEGAVDVYSVQPMRATAFTATRVTSGHSAVIDARNAAPVVATVDAARVLSWRAGRLEYINEPLSAIVADLNRYSTKRVVIGDAAVGDIVFSGTVFTDATDVWLRALPQVFPVDVSTAPDGDVVLTPRAQ